MNSNNNNDNNVYNTHAIKLIFKDGKKITIPPKKLQIGNLEAEITLPFSMTKEEIIPYIQFHQGMKYDPIENLEQFKEIMIYEDMQDNDIINFSETLSSSFAPTFSNFQFSLFGKGPKICDTLIKLDYEQHLGLFATKYVDNLTCEITRSFWCPKGAQLPRHFFDEKPILSKYYDDELRERSGPLGERSGPLNEDDKIVIDTFWDDDTICSINYPEFFKNKKLVSLYNAIKRINLQRETTRKQVTWNTYRLAFFLNDLVFCIGAAFPEDFTTFSSEHLPDVFINQCVKAYATKLLYTDSIRERNVPKTLYTMFDKYKTCQVPKFLTILQGFCNTNPEIVKIIFSNKAYLAQTHKLLRENIKYASLPKLLGKINHDIFLNYLPKTYHELQTICDKRNYEKILYIGKLTDLYNKLSPCINSYKTKKEHYLIDEFINGDYAKCKNLSGNYDKDGITNAVLHGENGNQQAILICEWCNKTIEQLKTELKMALKNN